jgi:dienelactone hydrolase
MICILAFALANAGAAEGESSMIKPRVAPWVPPAGALHEKAAAPYTLLEGSFDLGTQVPGLPIVTCTYVIPITAKEVPAPTAPDMVLRFGWIGQNALAPGENTRELAVKYGFTVLTIQWPQQKVSLDDKTAFSLYPTSGSGDAWLRAVNCVRIIGRLPERKLFCIGYSAGGSASHQFTEWKPSVVEAYVAMGGRTFSASPSFTGPTLLMHSERDRSIENETLADALRATSYPALRVTYPPDWSGRGVRAGWAHNGDGAAWDFAFKWLAGIADQRAKNGNLVPYAQWPTVNDVKVPDRRSGEALVGVSKPPRIENEEAQLRVYGGLPRSTSPKASIVWLDHRFPSDEDELLASVEMLTGRGYLAGATLCDRDASSSAVAKALIKGLKPSPPVCIVLLQPRNDDLITIAEGGLKANKLIVIRPVDEPVAASIAALRKAAPKVYVLSSYGTDGNNALHAARLADVTQWEPVKHAGERYVQEIEYVDRMLAKDR